MTVENDGKLTFVRIPKQYDKLIISLRTTWANELSLDKEQSSYLDSLNALRLSCKMFRMNITSITSPVAKTMPKLIAPDLDPLPSVRFISLICPCL